MVEVKSEVTCKHCGSKAVVKYGKYNNVQRYWCKVCQRKFKGDDTLFHMKVSPEFISSALELYYTGSSIDDICQHFRNAKGYHPSKSVVYGWVDKFTDMAVDHFRQYKPQVGSEWACDETVLRLDKNKKAAREGGFSLIDSTDRRNLLPMQGRLPVRRSV